MSLWESTVDWLLSQEGGYVNDPGDPGGETKYGISKRAYPDLNIRALTRDQARYIYHRDYWKGLGLEQPWWVDDEQRDALFRRLVFDAGVNNGPWRAVVFVQKSYNRLDLGDRLVVDGVIGPLTHSAISGIAKGYRPGFLAVLVAERGGYYMDLAEEPGRNQYIRGWMNRLWSCVEGPDRANWSEYVSGLRDARDAIDRMIKEVEP